MKGTGSAAGLVVVAVALQVTGVVDFAWPVWSVLALAVATGVAADVMRARSRA